MTVFVLSAGWDYEGAEVVGAFESEDAAVAAISDVKGRYDYYTVTECILGEITRSEPKEIRL